MSNSELTFIFLFHQKLDILREGPLLIDSEIHKDPSSDTSGFKHRRSSSKWNDDISQAGSTITESTQAGELISVSSCGPKLAVVCLSVFLLCSEYLEME